MVQRLQELCGGGRYSLRTPSQGGLKNDTKTIHLLWNLPEDNQAHFSKYKKQVGVVVRCPQSSRLWGVRMRCPHCNAELGEGDSYDLMTAHRWNCNSKVGNKVREGLEREFNGQRDEDGY